MVPVTHVEIVSCVSANVWVMCLLRALLIEDLCVIPHAWLDAPGSASDKQLGWLMQRFRSAIFNAWCSTVSADLCARKGFRGGHLLDIAGSQQLMFGKEIKALLRCIWLMGLGKGFCRRGFGVSLCLLPSVGNTDGDGHLFWEFL